MVPIVYTQASFEKVYSRYALFSSQNRNKGICFVEKK